MNEFDKWLIPPFDWPKSPAERAEEDTKRLSQAVRGQDPKVVKYDETERFDIYEKQTDMMKQSLERIKREQEEMDEMRRVCQKSYTVEKYNTPGIKTAPPPVQPEDVPFLDQLLNMNKPTNQKVYDQQQEAKKTMPNKKRVAGAKMGNPMPDGFTLSLKAPVWQRVGIEKMRATISRRFESMVTTCQLSTEVMSPAGTPTGTLQSQFAISDRALADGGAESLRELGYQLGRSFRELIDAADKTSTGCTDTEFEDVNRMDVPNFMLALLGADGGIGYDVPREKIEPKPKPEPRRGRMPEGAVRLRQPKQSTRNRRRA